MTLLAFTGLEGGTVGLYCASTNGNVSVQSTTKKTGTYALDCNPATTAATAYAEFSGITAAGANGSFAGSGVTTLFSSFDFQFEALPGSGDEEWFRAIGGGGGNRGIRLRLNSAGKLVAYQQNNTLIGTGSTTLSAGTWYRIDIKSNSSTTASYEVKINGVIEFTGTFSGSNDVIASVYLGKSTNTNTQKLRCYFDNMSWSNTAYFSNLAVVKAMFPDSNGSTMQWVSGPSPQDYTQVDDLPSDAGATYVQSAASANQTALFGLQSAASAGIGGTILGVSLQNSIRENTAGASVSTIQIRTNSANFGSSSNEITLGTTYVPHGYNWDLNPGTSAAWTVAELNALECGHAQSAAVAMRLDYTFVEVLYIPSQDETSLAGPGTGRASLKTFVAACIRKTLANGIASGRGSASAVCKKNETCDPRGSGRGSASLAPSAISHASLARATGRGSADAATASTHVGNGLGTGAGIASAVSLKAISDNAGPAIGSGYLFGGLTRMTNPLITGSGTLSALCRRAVTSAALLTGRGNLSSFTYTSDFAAGLIQGAGSASASCSFIKIAHLIATGSGSAQAQVDDERIAQARAFDRSGRVSGLSSKGVVTRALGEGEGRGVSMLAILIHISAGKATGRGTATATESKGGRANGRITGRGNAASACRTSRSAHGLATGRGRGTSRQSKQGVASGPMSAAGRSTALSRPGFRSAGYASGRGNLSCVRILGPKSRAYLYGVGRLSAESTVLIDYLAATVRLMELDLDAELHSDGAIVLDAEPYQPTIEARGTP